MTSALKTTQLKANPTPTPKHIEVYNIRFTEAKKLRECRKDNNPHKRGKRRVIWSYTTPMPSIPHRLLKGITNNAKPDCSHAWGLKPKSKLTHNTCPCPSQVTIAHAHPLSLPLLNNTILNLFFFSLIITFLNHQLEIN